MKVLLLSLVVSLILVGCGESSISFDPVDPLDSLQARLGWPETLNIKATMITAHLAESNPDGISKEDVGLGKVENISMVSLFSNPTFSGIISGLTRGKLCCSIFPWFR